MTFRAGSLLLAALALPLAAQAQPRPVPRFQTDPAQQQQQPAPIVRVRPRPQTGVPVNAPPDAAPLVNRAPRPHPINPQALSGVAAPSGATGPTARTRTVPSSAQQPRSSAAAGTGTQASTPHAARPAQAPPSTTTTAATATQASGEHQTSAERQAPPKVTLSSTLNRNIVVLDPAHGAQDSGSRIGDNILEKDVTLAFAFRLRSLLLARGFTVVLTRDSDAATAPNTPNTPLTLDDRAGIANHNRAAACLLLHATGRGTGVHLYTSELDPAPGEAALLPWLTAQAAWVPASQQLERNISSALGRSHITLVSSAASVRPVDSLTCPALVVELAPENNDPHSITDAGYQERVAQALAGALIFWQNQVQTPNKLNTGLPATHAAAHHHAPAAAKTPEPQP